MTPPAAKASSRLVTLLAWALLIGGALLTPISVISLLMLVAGWLVQRGVASGETWLPHASQRRVVARADELPHERRTHVTPLPRIAATALAVLLLAAALAAGVTPARAAESFDHGPWSKLLERYVDDDGRVAYRNLAARDAATLDAYLTALAAADPASWPRDEQLAFWLNAYNAVIFSAVLDGHSAESLFGRYRMFWRYHRVVAGAERTPDDIENRIVRPMGESRIHFALVCASASCPKLMRRAWQAATLDADLDAQARRFVNDPARNRIVPGAPEVELSAIFDWYDEDFGGSDDALRAYVARFADEPARSYLTQQRPELDFLDYDWTLNAQPGQRPD